VLIGRTAVAALAAVASLAATACEPGTASGGDPPSVIGTFYPLAEAAERVAGEHAVVRNLTPPGVEPHDLELAPDDLETLATAEVVVFVGGGFQPAIEDALGGVDGIAVDALEAAGDPLATTGGEDPGPASDPHVWLDPNRYARVVSAVADALTRSDPSHADEFRANAQAYLRELSDLDRAFREGLSACEQRTIVVSHAAFAYLADAYGLDQEAITGVSPEAEPDPKRLAELRALVEQDGLTTIFTEELVSPKVAETLANEAGVRTAVLNPLEGLTQEQSQAGEGYVSLMRGNLETLRDALGCS
jgi:zinc transport system substrate-binding protein